MSHRLQVLISDSLDAAIRKAAARRRSSKGEWVRMVLKKALEAEERISDPVEQLAALDGPTGDIGQILKEIEAGRG